MDAADREAVARVRAYPFRDEAGTAAGGCDPAVQPFTAGGGWDGEGPAVVAFGANVSAAVLAAKLGADAPLTAVPATLQGFDAVYSAHVSPHGAIPATLWPSPGTAIGVALLRMAPRALRALDATEPNYVRTGIAAGLDAYLSRHGALRIDGGEHALAAVGARGRTLPALHEAEVLDRVRAWLEPQTQADAFVLAGVRDAAVRERRTRALRGTVRRTGPP